MGQSGRCVANRKVEDADGDDSFEDTAERREARLGRIWGQAIRTLSLLATFSTIQPNSRAREASWEDDAEANFRRRKKLSRPDCE